MTATGVPVAPAGSARTSAFGPRTPIRWRRPISPATIVAAAIASAAGVWAAAGSALVLPHLSVNHDEAVYLLQADALAHGRLFPPAPEPSEAFRPWFAFESSGRFVLKYTPVHAGLLAMGRVLAGSERAALAVLAASAVGLMYLFATEVLGSRREGALAAALLALSPLFIVQTITFLPYVSEMVLLLAFGLCLLRGIRTGSRPVLAAAGFVLGVAFFARPYDAVLFALPFAAWMLWRQRREPGSVPAAGIAWIALGAALPAAASAWFNQVATGIPWRFPFTLIDPLDNVGFGRRRLVPGHAPFDYTVGAAWDALVRYAGLFAFWCGGGLVLIGLAIAGLRRCRGAEAAVAGIAVSVVVGYFCFWGPVNVAWMADRLGPFYYLMLLVPVAIGGAKGLARLAAWSIPLVVVAATAVAATSTFTTAHALQRNLRHSDDMAAQSRPIEAARLRRAVVFVPGDNLLNPFRFTRNDADFDGPVIWAIDRGGANFAVTDALPDREPYALRVPGWPPSPTAATSAAERHELQRLGSVRGEAIEWAIHVPATTGLAVVTVDVTIGRSAAQRFVLDQPSPATDDYRGMLRVTSDEVTLAHAAVTPASGVPGPAPGQDGLIAITVTAADRDGTPRWTVGRLLVSYRVHGRQLEVLAPTGGLDWIDAPRAGAAAR